MDDLPKKLSDNRMTYKANYVNSPIAGNRLRYAVLYLLPSRVEKYTGLNHEGKDSLTPVPVSCEQGIRRLMSVNLLSPVEQGALDSLFRAGATSALLSQVSGPDDFQLVCFLVVR